MSDFFGGLMKGLSGFMPQDDPDVKVMMAQSELNDLQKKEAELYMQIGKQALELEQGRFPELENKLRLVQASIHDAQEKLKSAQAVKDAKKAAQLAEEQEHTCVSCGCINSAGVKFCQECGAKLGSISCRNCGAKLPPGVRFCGECGAKQEG